MADLYPDYNKSQAYTLLFVQLAFIFILFCMLGYWHYSHPDSLEVTAQLQKQLLQNAPIGSQNQ